MTKKIFINLPVSDLNHSIDFFSKTGFTFHPQFTGDDTACMMISDNIFAMLLTEKRFRDFTRKEICNARRATEVLIAINLESREAVDRMVQKAVDAGGLVYAEAQDHGWMYGHSFADPDGHQWEVLFIEEGEEE